MADQDEQQLQLLSIFHYVVGALTALVACLPLIHVAIGVAMLVAPDAFDSSDPPPAFIAWVFLIAGVLAILIGWTMALLIILAGRFLAKRTHYTFCLVVAAIECLAFPFGTALGIFAIVVLIRDSVKQRFVADVVPKD